MDDDAGTRIMQNCGVFRNGVIRLHLEAPPISPNSRADLIVAQQISDFVAFDRMVECRYLIVKFLCHIEDERHFVGAVAVVLDRDVTIQYASQCFHAEVAGILFAAITLFLILLCLDPCLTVHGDIAHAC